MGKIDYQELLGKTIADIKKAVREKDVDLEKLLEVEKDNKDRKTLEKWLNRKIEKDKSREEDIETESLDDADIDADDRQRIKKLLNNLSGEESGAKKEDVEDFEERIEEHGRRFRDMRDMIAEVVVGQEEAVERVLIALMCDGHILLEGVPGLGKSLLVETLSRVVSGTDFNRIQFVPDMLPSDILGQRVYNQKKAEFYINKGPVFANFLLADEINRAPPKTQAAMMEVMQEKKVSIEKEEFDLDRPYLVLATQNPLEQKGTYPLPEAVIDRFFMKIILDYPEIDDEIKILEQNSIRNLNLLERVEEVVSKEQILQAQEDVRNIYISPKVRRYIVEVVNTARGRSSRDIEEMKYVDFGPSPRASIWISLAASAYAVMDGRTYIVPEDIKKVIEPILRHRILLNYEGEISDVSTEDVIEAVIENVDTV